MKEKIIEALQRLTQKYTQRMRESEGREREHWASFLSGISAAWGEVERVKAR